MTCMDNSKTKNYIYDMISTLFIFMYRNIFIYRKIVYIVKRKCCRVWHYEMFTWIIRNTKKNGSEKAK